MNRNYVKIRSFLGVVSRLDWLNRAARALLQMGVVAAVVLSVHALLVERISGSPWIAFSLALFGTLAIWIAAARLTALLVRPLSRQAAGRLVEGQSRELENDVTSSLHLGKGLAEEPQGAGV